MKKRDRMAALRDLSEDELFSEVLRLKKSAFSLRFRRVNGQVEKVSEVAALRRDVARAITVLSEKKKGGA